MSKEVNNALVNKKNQIFKITMEQKTSNEIKSSKDEMHELNSENKKDLCDCMDETCIGCFFPCENCKSTKCGHVCRVGRKWNYSKWRVINGGNEENSNENIDNIDDSDDSDVE